MLVEVYKTKTPRNEKRQLSFTSKTQGTSKGHYSRKRLKSL